MVIALLGVWTSVAVVWFDLVDYEEVLGKNWTTRSLVSLSEEKWYLLVLCLSGTTSGCSFPSILDKVKKKGALLGLPRSSGLNFDDSYVGSLCIVVYGSFHQNNFFRLIFTIFCTFYLDHELLPLVGLALR